MSHLLKLDRAELHLDRLRESVDQWAEQNPYGFTTEDNLQDLTRTMRLKLKKPFPKTWSVEAGDVLFNIRSGLDHLAHTLSEIGKGSTLTERESRDCSFPIFATEAIASQRWKSTIGLASQPVQGILKKLQPYHAFQYRRDPLWVLKALNDIDKHRSLHVTALQCYGFKVKSLINLELLTHVSPDTNMDDGSEIARFRILDPDMEARTRIDCKFPILECFGDVMTAGAVFPVVQGLDIIVKHVRQEVLPPLEPFLI